MRSVSSLLLFGAILAMHLLFSSERVTAFNPFKGQRKTIQHYQDKVNGVVRRQPRDATAIVKGLMEEGIKHVVVFSEPSADLTALKKAAQTTGSIIRRLKVLELPPGTELPRWWKRTTNQKRVWIIDSDHTRLRRFSQSNPVSWGTPIFTFEHLQSFIPILTLAPVTEKNKITQKKLNSLVLNKRHSLAPRDFVDTCIKGGVEAFVFDWEDTAVDVDLRSLKRMKVKKGFLAVAREIAGRGVPYYIVTFSDSQHSDVHGVNYNDQHLAGSVLVWKMLHDQGLQPTAIFAYDPRYFNKQLDIDKVSFAKKLPDDKKQIHDKTLHLRQVLQHSGLPPDRILYFDDEPRFAEAAVALGHLALHVNNQLRQKGETAGLFIETLSPVKA